MISHSYRKSTAAALALGLLSAPAFAHLPSSALEGSAAPGDTVSIRNVDTDHHLQSLVANTGRFHFHRLPIGIYEVVIHHPDGSAEEPIFARARLGETVQVNRKDRTVFVNRASDRLVTVEDQANGSRSTMVASRSGPVETIASGQPTSSSKERK